MGRLRRFLMLERPRDAAGEERVPAARMTGRFDVLAAGEPVAASAADPAPAAAQPRDRFAPPPEPAAALDTEAVDDERPSTRCLACGAENGRFAARCSGCAASLRDRAVVRLNRRLWDEERRAVSAARAARTAARAAEVDALAAERRARAEAEVESVFQAFVADRRERGATRPIDRAAELVGRGPLGRTSLAVRRGALTGAVLLAIAAISLVPGAGPRLFQIGLAVVLVAAWLRPAR